VSPAGTGGLATGPGTTAPAASAGERPGAAAPIRYLGFLGVAIASFGGPLALAALYAPGIAEDVSGSAGLATAAAGLIFLVPLAVWLRYARDVAGDGGLTGFVQEAVGRRVALVQAGIWTTSYLLYLMYTTTYVVYDVLPAVVPGITPYQQALEVTLPVAIAAAVLAPRRVTIGLIGLIAAGQLALTGLLAGIGLAHATPASAFTPAAPRGAAAAASANIALLFVCGSLPLFLGGEVDLPHRTMRRGLAVGFAVSAVAVVLAVFPLAAEPAFLRADIPGVAFAHVESGPAAGVAVGLGVVASILGVMLIEYVALTRLAHFSTGWSTRGVARAIAVPLIAAGPVSLLDPGRFYLDLLKPSLVALWLAQLIPMAVYPWFAARRGRLRAADVALAVGGSALMIFGLHSSLIHQVAT